MAAVPVLLELLTPFTKVRLQVMVVPVVVLVGVYVKGTPLHCMAAAVELLNLGMGLTITTTRKVSGWGQPPALKLKNS